MCHYNVIYCESCMAITRFPPEFCDKINSGIVCTRVGDPDKSFNDMSKLCMAAIYDRAYDPTNKEIRLYDILPAIETWVDSSKCICGLGLISSDDDNLGLSYTNNDTTSEDSENTEEFDLDYWISMGTGGWDNNGGSPQWVPET